MKRGVIEQIATVDENIWLLDSTVGRSRAKDIDKSRRLQFEFQQELFDQKRKLKEMAATQTGPREAKFQKKIFTAKLSKLSITKFNEEDFGTIRWER